MRWQRSVALLLTAFALASPARAGIFFNKKKPAPVDPNQRVPELLGLVKTSPDENQRAKAAEELRKYDPQAFPDMVPVLIDVLASDPKAPVRSEAAHTLSKLRPVSVPVGQALERALAKDPSMRVRLQTRSALLQYHWAGYRTPKNGVPTQTKEPPLAPPLPGPTEGPPTLPGPSQGPPPLPGPSQGTPPGVTTVAPPEQGPPPVIVTAPAGQARDPSIPVIKMTPVTPVTPPAPAAPVTPGSRPLPKGPDLTTPPKW